MNQKTYRIAQFGTFDVESMGDSLFPHGLLFGLKKHCQCEIELFSMRECENPYNNNGHVYAFEQFGERHAQNPFDLMILGGGEFLHFETINFMVDGQQKPYEGGYLWRNPIQMAQKAEVPVAINCVGVPHDLSVTEQRDMREYLSGVLCVSVRDMFSAKRLRDAGVANVHCVADNLWYMNEMYPEAELAAARKKLEKRTGRDFSTPYMIVQYGTTKNPAAFADQLRHIKSKTGYRICLMPVNYCHEDRVGMELLAKQGNGDFECITDYFQPPEMIALISGAKVFVGTSLHGNLTAASYGVPFVGVDMYSSFVSKMDGIFSMIGCEEYLIPDETALAAALYARLDDHSKDAEIAEKVRHCQSELDLHFERMAEILKGAR